MSRRSTKAVVFGGPRKFYVDATLGNNANSGRFPSSAWQTEAAVNAYTGFRSGDRVLFKRGETWALAASLAVPADGLIFGTYGSGANPILDGQDTVNCVDGNGKNNIRFENIDVTQGLDFGFIFQTVHGITLTSCNAHDCGNDNVNFDDCYDCSISGGSFYNGYVRLEDNRIVTGIEIMDGSHDITISGAECYANAGKAAPAHYAAGISIHAHAGSTMPYNITVQSCNLHDGGVNCFGLRVNNANAAVMTDRNILIANNTVQANAYGGIQINSSAGAATPTNGVTIRDNQVLLNTVSFGINLINSSNVDVYRNVITNNNNLGTAQNIAINTCTDTNIWNNTTYSLFDNFWYSIQISGAGCSNVVVKNNIIGGSIASLCHVYVGAGTGVGGMVIDYNLYQFAGVGNRWTWNGGAVNYANWQAAGNDTHSPARADPLFTAPSGDLTLQATSPAINAGVDVGLAFLGSAPDCGYAEKA